MSKLIVQKPAHLEIQNTLISIRLKDIKQNTNEKYSKTPIKSYIQQFQLFKNANCKQKTLDNLEIFKDQANSLKLLHKSHQGQKILYQMIEQQRHMEKTLLLKRMKSQGGIMQSIQYLPIAQVKLNNSRSQIVAANVKQASIYSKKKSNIGKYIDIKLNRRNKIQSLRKNIQELDIAIQTNDNQLNKNGLPVKMPRYEEKESPKCQMNFYHRQLNKSINLQQKYTLDFQQNFRQPSNLKKKYATTPISGMVKEQQNINKSNNSILVQQNQKSKSLSIKQNIQQNNLYPKVIYHKLIPNVQRSNYNSTNLTPTIKLKQSFKNKKLKRINKNTLSDDQPQMLKANQTFFNVDGWQHNHIMDQQQYIPQEIHQQVEQCQK